MNMCMYKIGIYIAAGIDIGIGLSMNIGIYVSIFMDLDLGFSRRIHDLLLTSCLHVISKSLYLG